MSSMRSSSVGIRTVRSERPVPSTACAIVLVVAALFGLSYTPPFSVSRVEVDGAYYSAPPGHLGQRLPVQWDGQTVRLLEPRTGQLLREHPVLAVEEHFAE